MASLVTSNSSTLLKTENINHYSSLDGRLIEDESLIESLPSLYFSEVTKTEDDTEDDDDDIEKAPPVSKDASSNAKDAPLPSQLLCSCSSAAQNSTFISPQQFNSSSFTFKMDIRSPPQPSQSTSRFMNALHRLRSVNKQTDNSVAPVDLKPVPSKSSLADKIKNKFHQQLKNRSSLLADDAVTRSSSISSLSNWSSRLGSRKSAPPRNIVSIDTAPSDEGSIKKTSAAPSFSLTKSISSHRLYNKQQQEPPRRASRPRQPLRAVNHNKQTPPPSPQKTTPRKGGVRFTKLVSVRETFSKAEYDRASDPEAVCVRLTPAMAQQIKEELNAYKLHEMQVHEASRIHTHFFI